MGSEEVLDDTPGLNVPAPPSLDGHMKLLEFPEVEEIPEETPAAHIQRKQEFRQRLGPGGKNGNRG